MVKETNEKYFTSKILCFIQPMALLCLRHIFCAIKKKMKKKKREMNPAIASTNNLFCVHKINKRIDNYHNATDKWFSQFII